MAGQRNKALGTLSFNPYAAGKKRYMAGASFAPTVGHVDKAGYIERDQKKKQKSALTSWLAKRRST